MRGSFPRTGGIPKVNGYNSTIVGRLAGLNGLASPLVELGMGPTERAFRVASPPKCRMKQAECPLKTAEPLVCIGFGDDCAGSTGLALFPWNQYHIHASDDGVERCRG